MWNFVFIILGIILGIIVINFHKGWYFENKDLDYFKKHSLPIIVWSFFIFYIFAVTMSIIS